MPNGAIHHESEIRNLINLIMMKNLVLLVILSLVTTFTINAQTETLFGRFGMTGITGSATYNFSYFEDDTDLFRGGNIGFEFGRSVTIGYGWDRIQDDVQLEGINNSFRLRYNGLMISYAPNSRRVVHPRFTILAGGGRASLTNGPSDKVFVLQPSGGIEFNVFRWFKFGVEGGYRVVSNSNLPDLDDQDLSSPFFQMRLTFGIHW